MAHGQLKDQFSKFLEEAVKEGLDSFKPVIEEGKSLNSYYNFPTISFNENGMPESPPVF